MPRHHILGRLVVFVKSAPNTLVGLLIWEYSAAHTPHLSIQLYYYTAIIKTIYKYFKS